LLSKEKIDPLQIAISYVHKNDFCDFFLIGLEKESQLKEIFDIEIISPNDFQFLELFSKKISPKLLDPRNWI